MSRKQPPRLYGETLSEYEDRIASERLTRTLVSGAIAYGTGSAIAGALIGGDVGGAIIGDLLEGGGLFD